MNSLNEEIARHFHEVNFGGNWTDASVEDVLKNITYEQATKSIGNANTIALLVFHMDFYNMVVYDRLVGVKRHFEHEESLKVSVHNEADWLQLKAQYFSNAKKLHAAILAFDPSRLFETTTSNTPYKNLHGVVEHVHYHLGQIALLKKLV